MALLLPSGGEITERQQKIRGDANEFNKLESDALGYFADYYQAEKAEQYVSVMEYDTEMVSYYSTVTGNFYDTFIRINELVKESDERILKIIEQYTNIINQLVLIISLTVTLTASFIPSPYVAVTDTDDFIYKSFLAIACISGAIAVTDGIFLAIKLTDITSDFIGGQDCDYIPTDIINKKTKQTLYLRHFEEKSISDLTSRITLMIIEYLFLLISTVGCGAMLMDTREVEFWSLDNVWYIIVMGILSLYIFIQFFRKYSYVINFKAINTIQDFFGLSTNTEDLTAQLISAVNQFHQFQADLYCIIHSHNEEMAKIIDILNKAFVEYEEASRKSNLTDKEFYYFSDVRQNNLEQLPGMNKRIEVFNNQINRMKKNTFEFDEYTTEEMKDYTVSLKLTQLLSTINAQRTHMTYLYMRQAKWDAKCKSNNIYDLGNQKFSLAWLGLGILEIILYPIQLVTAVIGLALVIITGILSNCGIRVNWRQLEPYILFIMPFRAWKVEVLRNINGEKQHILKLKKKDGDNTRSCKFEREGEWKIKLNKQDILNF